MERVDRFLFAPASGLGVVAARIVLATQALWIVLSHQFAELSGWPSVFWPRLPRLRFGIVPGSVDVDRVLYWLLIISLLAVLFGIRTRLACWISAVLIYHFAPMEAVLGGLTYTTAHSGLTLPLLGFLVLGAAESPRDWTQSSLEYGWPVRLIQVILCFHYIGGGLAKLIWSGFPWYAPQNIAGTAATLWTIHHAPLGLVVYRTAWLATLIAVCTFVIEFCMPLALFSKWARRILIPLAFVAAFLRAQVFGLFFLTFPSILLLLNWDWIARYLSARVKPAEQVRAAEAEA